MTTQVRTDEMHKHIGDLVRYGAEKDDTWSRLVAVRDSDHQGWDIVLEVGTLQSCFGETEHEVREQLFGVDADWVRANVGLD